MFELDVSHVKSQLDKTINKIKLSSPVYRQKIEEIQSRKNRLDDLINEENQLKKLIQQELYFSQNKDYLIHCSEEACEKAKNRKIELSNQLREEIIKNSSFSISKGEIPIVNSPFSLQGNTPLIEQIRLKSRIIQTKAKLLKQSDKLHSLQKAIFCLDSDSDSSQYFTTEIPILFDSECLPNNTPDFPTSSAMVPSELIALTDVFHFIHTIRPISPKPMSLSLISFKPHSSTNLPLDPIYHPDPFSSFDSLNSLTNEISHYQNPLQNTLIRINKKPQISFLNISDTLSQIISQLYTSRSTVNHLHDYIIRNTQVPSNIWFTERIIHTKMEHLINTINKLLNRVYNEQNIPPLTTFGYSPNTSAITVNETSYAQLQRFEELCTELQNSILNCKSIFEEQHQQFEAIRKHSIERKYDIKEYEQKQEEDNEIKINNYIKEIKISLQNHLEDVLESVSKLVDSLPNILSEMKLLEIPKHEKLKLEVLRLPKKIEVPDIIDDPQQNNENDDETNLKLLEKICDETYSVEPLKEVFPITTTESQKEVDNQRISDMLNDWKEKLEKFSNDTN